MKVSPELLKKYASQRCSRQEKDIVEQWLKTTGKTDDEEEIAASDLLGEKMWSNIKNATIADPEKAQYIHRKRIMWSVAASIALLIGIGIIFRQSGRGPDVRVKNLVCQTKAGQMKNITLSDGTVIYLNANSILKVSEKFAADNRIVSLEGEAYFDVKKDSLHPFTIQTRKSETKVLGTKFNLSAYPDESTALTLDEGKVSFKSTFNAADSIIVLPNEQALLDDKSLKKATVSTKYYKGWMNNVLYFNNETFLAVSHKIERIYGVSIQIKNPQLKNQLYKGEFNNPGIATLLEDLSYVLKFRYEIKNNQITIY